MISELKQFKNQRTKRKCFF